MTETVDATRSTERIVRIDEVSWTVVDLATCHYKIRCRAELGTPVFAAIYGGNVIGHDCDSPPGPVMFRPEMGSPGYYEADVCLCGIGGDQTVAIIVSEPIGNDPENPSHAVTFTISTPAEGCPECPNLGGAMPAAARTAAPAAKAAKPAKAKPAKKPAPKKPAKPVKKVVAKKPAPKKPAKPVKKKPGRRK